MLADPDAALQRQRLRVEHPDLVIGLVADVELSRSRMDRDARQKHFLRLRFRLYRAVERRRAIRIVEDMNLARVAARDEALLAVAAEGQAIPALRQREKLRLLATGDIEHRQAVLVEPAVRGQQPLSVRRDHQLERQIAHRHMLAGGRDTPAVEQQVLIRQQPRSRAQARAIHVFVRPTNRPRARRRTGGNRKNQGHPEPECPHQILVSHHALLYAHRPLGGEAKKWEAVGAAGPLTKSARDRSALLACTTSSKPGDTVSVRRRSGVTPVRSRGGFGNTLVLRHLRSERWALGAPVCPARKQCALRKLLQLLDLCHWRRSFATFRAIALLSPTTGRPQANTAGAPPESPRSTSDRRSEVLRGDSGGELRRGSQRIHTTGW